jgi:PAS domain S-box-containing protein
MFDRQMRYLSVSRRWLHDYNLGERDLIGTSHYEVFPEMPEYWKEVHRRGLAGEVVRADGSVQWVRWEVRPWRDAADNIAGIVIFSEDITERKRMEEDLLRSRDELEVRVKERSAELQMTNRALTEHAVRLERLNEELRDFAFIASHDLQEPVRKIQVLGDLRSARKEIRCSPGSRGTGLHYAHGRFRETDGCPDTIPSGLLSTNNPIGSPGEG